MGVHVVWNAHLYSRADAKPPTSLGGQARWRSQTTSSHQRSTAQPVRAKSCSTSPARRDPRTALRPSVRDRCPSTNSPSRSRERREALLDPGRRLKPQPHAPTEPRLRDIAGFCGRSQEAPRPSLCAATRHVGNATCFARQTRLDRCGKSTSELPKDPRLGLRWP